MPKLIRSTKMPKSKTSKEGKSSNYVDVNYLRSGKGLFDSMGKNLQKRGKKPLMCSKNLGEKCRCIYK